MVPSCAAGSAAGCRQRGVWGAPHPCICPSCCPQELEVLRVRVAELEACAKGASAAQVEGALSDLIRLDVLVEEDLGRQGDAAMHLCISGAQLQR